jgi:hypothetical protein
MPDLVAWVISTNIRRRHLNAAQKRDLLAVLLKADTKKSNRQVAKAAGVSDKTVASVRNDLERGAEIPHHEKHKDAKGVEQPARKPPAKPRNQIGEFSVRDRPSRVIAASSGPR